MKVHSLLEIETSATECAICIEDFVKNETLTLKRQDSSLTKIAESLPWSEDLSRQDKVVILQCHESHVYHEKCMI